MILVINTGSSSIKIALLKRSSGLLLADGLAQRLGEEKAALTWVIAGESIQHNPDVVNERVPGHQSVMAQMLEILFSRIDKNSITAVGHRVVHGGEKFVLPTLLDEGVIEAIQALSHLAPLHNPANISGVQAAMKQLPHVPHVAVFDTAFHQTMPEHASLYAVPYAWYEQYGVRRYGFHGSSHHFVALAAAKILGREFEACKMITIHLGNGCSATAIANGKSVDTTMGLTPLAGLVMGTRSGDVDPGLISFMARQSGESLSEITDHLNRQSGLLGLSGLSNDMRTLLQASQSGDKRATLAIDIFCYRLAKELAGLAIALGHVDAIVFTGGIGEHAAPVREKTVALLHMLGVKIDAVANGHHGKLSHGFISAADSAVATLVVPTNEEKMIADLVCTLLD